MAARRVFAISRQPDVSRSSRCTSRGFAGPWRRASPPACRRHPARDAGAALHGKPCGLVQHHDVGVLEQDHVLQRLQRLGVAASDSWPATFGVSSLSGGMRMLCPSSIRSLLSARLPLTRSSPFRTMRWMWENDRPGKRASRNDRRACCSHRRSRPQSGPWSATQPQAFWARRQSSPARGTNGAGFGPRGDEVEKRDGALPPRTMRRPLGLRAPVGTRAFRAIARWAERFLDATAHGAAAPDEAVR